MSAGDARRRLVLGRSAPDPRSVHFRFHRQGAGLRRRQRDDHARSYSGLVRRHARLDKRYRQRRRSRARALDPHRTRVVSRYRGKIKTWHVVNEPIDDAKGAVAGLRPSIWLQRLGAKYIDTAFRLAHQADPAAELLINEYDIECVGERRRCSLEQAQAHRPGQTRRTHLCGRRERDRSRAGQSRTHRQRGCASISGGTDRSQVGCGTSGLAITDRAPQRV